MKEPRKWSLILIGPNSGPISTFGDTWPRSPEHFERVAIMEILPDMDLPAACTHAPDTFAELDTFDAPPALALPATAKKAPTQVVVNESLDELARSLGIVFNDLIPHNAGWFVPGYQRGYASSGDAIRGLFAVLKQAAISRAVVDALPDHAQPSLF